MIYILMIVLCSIMGVFIVSGLKDALGPINRRLGKNKENYKYKTLHLTV